jgi:hypothetical protein
MVCISALSNDVTAEIDQAIEQPSIFPVTTNVRLDMTEPLNLIPRCLTWTIYNMHYYL